MEVTERLGNCFKWKETEEDATVGRILSWVLWLESMLLKQLVKPDGGLRLDRRTVSLLTCSS